MSTYREIRRLVDALVQGTAVQKRRSALRELLEMVSRVEVRQRLATEAYPSGLGSDGRKMTSRAKRVRQRRALSEVWRSIIRGVCAAVDDISKGKTKLSEDDIKKFQNILTVCDSATEGFDECWNAHKLSRKEVKLVLSLCLDLLEDEAAVDIAEVKLLEVLAFICSKSEYVAHFRPTPEIQVIMEEVEKRIGAQTPSKIEQQRHHFDAVEGAAHVFKNVIKTASEQKIALDLFIAGGLKLIGGWCAKNIASQDGTITLSFGQKDLLSAVTHLIRSNPEQAIAPLSRHGRAILSFAKRCYNGDKVQQHVINEYFLGHILVSQVAGQLQGLMPGDFGDIATATLSNRQVSSILDFLMKENFKRERSTLPLTRYQRTGLELTARLLAYAQRKFISTAEWSVLGSSSDERTEALCSFVQDADEVDSHLQIPLPPLGQTSTSCPSDVVAQSPFFNLVLGPLYSTVCNSTKHSGRVSGIKLLEALQNSRMESPLSSQHIAPLLQVLSAASEIFISGGCWTTEIQSSWKKLDPDREYGFGPFFVLASSPDDLAAVIQVVVQILESHGTASGNEEIQRWALICLIKLTDSTLVQSLFHRENVASFDNLRLCWRDAWRILFRTDMRYACCTKISGANSIGRLVTMLVSRIFSRFCTDPGASLESSVHSRQSTFLYGNQSDVWKLPLFSMPDCVENAECFHLIEAVLSTVGLSESHDDAICSRADDLPLESSELGGRRYRLLDFCLRILESRRDVCIFEELSTCLAYIVAGSHRESAINYKGEKDVLVSTLDSFPPRSRAGLTAYNCLWEEPLQDGSNILHVIDGIRSDPVIVHCQLLRRMVLLNSSQKLEVDFVPPSQSSLLASAAFRRVSTAFEQRKPFDNVTRSYSTDNDGSVIDKDPVASLYEYILSMKIILTILFSRPERFEKFHDHICSGLSSMLLRTVSVLESKWLDSSSVSDVISCVWQVLQSIHQRERIHQKLSLLGPITSLCRVIREAFEGITRFDEDVDDDMQKEDGYDQDFLMDDEPSERVVSPKLTGKKRKQSATIVRNAKKKLSESMVDRLSHRGQVMISSLLVAIDPCYDVCRIVSNFLIGTNDIESENEVDSDVDILGAVVALKLLCGDTVLLHRSALQEFGQSDQFSAEGRSIVALICRLATCVSLVGVSDPEVTSICIQHCYKLVSCYESESKLSVAEASLVVDALKGCQENTDRRNLWVRPHLRALQLSSAIKSFAAGKENFHSVIDREFPRFFVLPSLSDSDGSVRRLAAEAVGSAIKVLPEDRVVESVRKRVAPLSSNLNMKDALAKYRIWYSEGTSEARASLNSNQQQVWEDIYLSVECGMVACWVSVAASSSSDDIMRDFLFQMVALSFRRPHIEAFCFLSMQRLALLRGFLDCESLIEAEREFILQRWMESGYSLLDLPLTVTSPATLRRTILLGPQEKDSSTFYSEKLRLLAATECLVKCRKLLVPRILSLTSQTGVKSSDADSKRRGILGDRFMREMCSVFKDHFDDRTAKLILKRHIPDILAYKTALVYLGGSEDDKLKGIDRTLQSVLTDNVVQRQGERNVGEAVHTFLTIVGGLIDRRGSPTEELVDTLFEGFRSLRIEFGDKNCLKDCDMFSRVGSSALECLVYLKYKLARIQSPHHMKKLFTSIHLVQRIVIEDLRHHSKNRHVPLNMGVCLRNLLDMLSDSIFEPVHPLIPVLIREVVSDSLAQCRESPYIRDVLRGIAHELLVRTLAIHERYQKLLINHALETFRGRRVCLRRCLGFKNDAIHGSNSAGSFEETEEMESLMDALTACFAAPKSQIYTETTSIISGTYGVIDVVLQNADILGIDRRGIDQAFRISSAHLQILANLKPGFCAQKLLVPEAQSNHEGNYSCKEQLLSQILIGSARMPRSEFAKKTAPLLLLAERFKIESRGNVPRKSDVYDDDLGDVKLVQALVDIIRSDFPQEITRMAGQCLGEVFKNSMREGGLLSEDADLIRGPFDSKQLEAQLLGKCVEYITECSMYKSGSIATVALETLKLLLDSPAGTSTLEFVRGECRQLVAPLVDKTKTGRELDLTLTERELERLRRAAFRLCKGLTNGDEWCWDQQLWVAGGLPTCSSDSWISCVVPSIISTCFSAEEKDGEMSSSASTFKVFERLSSVDAGFAHLVFPVIVISLLRRSENVEKPSDLGAMRDTFVGDKDSSLNIALSSCFEALLTSFNSETKPPGATADYGAVETVLDTCDLLRRLTQFNFIASSRHRKNRAGPHGSQTPLSNEAIDIESPIWCGVPFGVVLRLDGLLVSSAFYRARRFASALFYAEMFADARFGSSSRAIHRIAALKDGDESLYRYLAEGDISGFGAVRDVAEHSQKNSPTFDQRVGSDAEIFLRVLRDCHAQLHDDESRSAIDQFTLDLFPPNPGGRADNLSSECTESGPGQSLDFLQRLDATMNFEGRNSSLGVSLAFGLERVGLRNVAQSFIESIGPGSLSIGDSSQLRDKWFECALYRLRWDDSFFNGDESNNAFVEDNQYYVPPGADSGLTSGFHHCMIEALYSFAKDDHHRCRERLGFARGIIEQRVRAFGGPQKPLNALSDTIDRLKALNDFEALVNSPDSHRKALELHVADMGKGDEKYLNLSLLSTLRPVRGDFSDCLGELILRTMHSKALREGRKENAASLHKASVVHLWNTCVSYCEEGNHNEATGALDRLRVTLSSVTKEEKETLCLSLRLQEARILYGRGDFPTALRRGIHIVNQLNSKPTDDETKLLLSDALVACGRWMGKHKIAPADTVLRNYLQPGSQYAVSLFNKQKKSTDALRATRSLIELGQLASDVCDTVCTRIESSEWRKSGSLLKERENELKQCTKLISEQQSRSQKTKGGSKEQRNLQGSIQEALKYKRDLEKQILNASQERIEVEKSIHHYRQLALRSFTSALSIANGDRPDDLSRHVYGMVSIWFSSNKPAEMLEICEIVLDAVERVPSFRFVPLASQLFSRLVERKWRETDLYEILRRLILRICSEHPYHSLTHLIHLSNRRDSVNPCRSSGEGQQEVASSIMEALRKESIFLGDLLDGYQILCEAYVHLAMASTHNLQDTEHIPFSKVCRSGTARIDLCLGNGPRLRTILPCVLTSPPPLRPGGDYGEPGEDPIGGERVVGFENTFSVAASGITRPKIVVCIGSQGGRYKQLVKGHDEIRQDAVMEQVFAYVNELMSRRVDTFYSDEEYARSERQVPNSSLRRALRLVTYSIIPLSPTSGVMEWVQDTVPFFNCLVDKSSNRGKVAMHSRYYPGEWSNSHCSKFLQNSKSKRNAFDTICKFHSPCFRFFFIEAFGHSLQEWYNARLRYSRSVATSSIVGHILGIGDRHGCNILVHGKTGEVVHIDFGIAYEQGKLLNTPEVVPFRLTQNIVDGLGPTGTDGVFTDASETTLGVLKRNSAALLTILSAVVSDPLYKWSMSPVKARERQKLTDDSNNDSRRNSIFQDESERTSDESGAYDADQNEAASQAIAKIKAKLQGYEDGTSGEQQSIKGQVQLLINSARDPDNLSAMYHGWAPWV